MSAPAGVVGRRHDVILPPRLASLAAIPLGLAILATGLASADVPSAALRLSAGDAARAGVLIGVTSHRIGAAELVEVEASRASLAAADPTVALLAVSADGLQVALADRIGEASGSLTIAREDGSQLRVQLRGLLGAAFAPGGGWLAVVDGRGALWRLDTLSGDALPLADGPFIGSPIVTADSALLLISVPSVAAPYRSSLVRLDPDSGATTTLSSDELVYAGFPLEVGGLAVVVHLPDGTVVRRIVNGASQPLANLGPGAINVAVAPDGKRLAFEVAGEIFVLDDPLAAPRSVGPGGRPCFGPDASRLLVHRAGERVLIAPDGSTLYRTERPAGLAGAAGCLP